MRETEDQLKVIPQFCFPDAKDWAPVDNFPRSVSPATKQIWSGQDSACFFVVFFAFSIKPGNDLVTSLSIVKHCDTND